MSLSSAALLGIALACIGSVLACSNDAFGNANRSAASAPASAPGAPDLETARTALRVLLERSDEAALKARVVDLAKEPELGKPNLEAERRGDYSADDYDYRFSPYVKLQIYRLGWQVQYSTDRRGVWFCYGKFQRDANGKWVAVVTSTVPRGHRGGQ